MAKLIFGIAGAYFLLGLLVAIPFVILGARRIDPAAANGSWGFKLFIIPGTIVFWPLMLIRWVKGQEAPEEKSAHRT